MPVVLQRWMRYGIAALAFGVVAAAWHYGTRQSGGIRPASERRAMPDLVMTQLDGETWKLAEHRGQVVLVNFWATWCGPCWEETPGLIRLSQELGPKGLAIVGVAIDEGGPEKITKFVKDFGGAVPGGEAGEDVADGVRDGGCADDRTRGPGGASGEDVCGCGAADGFCDRCRDIAGGEMRPGPAIPLPRQKCAKY